VKALSLIGIEQHPSTSESSIGRRCRRYGRCTWNVGTREILSGKAARRNPEFMLRREKSNPLYCLRLRT
jgi:hypothetical protein